MSKPVILILGAGSRVGQSVAQIFASKGYKVALTARKVQETDSTPDQLNIAGDLADPSTVADVFSKVRAKLGTPSVVVYNAAAGTKLDPEDPLSISLDDYRQTLNVNNISVFVAAQEAARGFAELSSNASKTFIFTGNILNVTTMPFLFNAGVGKAATANLIQCVADVYKDRGFKFYYADERKADGSAAFGIDGDAHAKLFMELAQHKSQGPWQQTFVKGIGYQKF